MMNLPLLTQFAHLQYSNGFRTTTPKGLALLCTLGLLPFLPNSFVLSQEPNSVPSELKLEELFGEPTGDSVRWLSTFLSKNPDWALSINEQTAVLHSFKTPIKGSIEIPRLATMVESISGKVRETDCEVKIEPLVNTWKLSWDLAAFKEEDGFELIITMQCNDRPVTLPQATPITASADGVIRLTASRSSTAGTAIRYEPQSYKNTIGWWTSASDSASWDFQSKQPGRYSIAILYGCAKGQGGSPMKLSLKNLQFNEDSVPATTLDFTVKETGHFQNFQWQTIGELELPSAGLYKVTLQPTKIIKNAAMDIREVQLVRQAN